MGKGERSSVKDNFSLCFLSCLNTKYSGLFQSPEFLDACDYLNMLNFYNEKNGSLITFNEIKF